MTDDALIIRMEPVGQPARRHRFEPIGGGEWRHYEEEWAGDPCGWHTVGSQIVEGVGVSLPTDHAGAAVIQR